MSTQDEVPNGQATLTLHQRSVEAATGFAELCARITEQPDEADFWTFLSQDVSVDQELQVAVTRTWRLDSARLLDYVELDGSQELIPLAPLVTPRPSFDSLSLTSLFGRRVIHPTPHPSLGSLFRGDTREWERWIAVPMSAEEYSSSPVVQLTSRPAKEPELAIPFRLKQLLPVSTLEVTFGGEGTSLTAITATFPSPATVDVVAISCRVDWSNYVRELDGFLTLHEADTEAQEGARRILLDYADNVATVIQGRLAAISEMVTRTAEDVLGSRGYKRTMELWQGGLADSKEAVNKWGGAWRSGESVSTADAVLAVTSLRNGLESGASFIVPTHIDRAGRINVRPIISALRGHVEATSVQTLIVPFTSENEPGTQGKRSGFILLLLAAVLLSVALIDLSWLPRRDYLEFLPNYTIDTEAASVRAADLREAVVALLLIFPAALYGQFFQIRPTSVVGHRAQAGTFAALSVLFALPIFPAALLATGGTLASTAIMTATIGLLALIAGVTVWRTFTHPGSSQN